MSESEEDEVEISVTKSGEKDESLSARPSVPRSSDSQQSIIDNRLFENSDADDEKEKEGIKGRIRQQTPSTHTSAASSDDLVYQDHGGIVDSANGTTTGPDYEDV